MSRSPQYDDALPMIADTSAGLQELDAIQRQIGQRENLDKLTPEQLKSIAEYVMLRKYADEMERNCDLLEYDYAKLKNAFLYDFLKAVNTRLAYANAFRYFEEYMALNKISNPFAMSFEQADGYVYFLQGKNLSNGSIRQFVTAASSLFTYVSRISNGKVRNVFLGSFAIPKKKIARTGKFYDKGVNEKILENVREDFETIYSSLKNKELKAIVRIMIDSGLRVGAFTGRFSYDGGFFKTVSKGKEVRGVLSGDSLHDIEEAGLEKKHTFRKWNADKIKNLFKYYSKKLFMEGRIRFEYSCHDARHMFAIRNYLLTRDIYAVSKLLNHSSVVITEEYLRGLNVDLTFFK